MIQVKFDNHFKLYSYHDALQHSTIINSNQLDYYTWVELPHEISRHLVLYEILSISPDGSDNLNFKDKIKRECNRPWIQIETSLLDTTVGYHLYKLSFIDHRTDDTIALYFNYRIQTDNPDKSSYVYMDR